MTKPKNKRLSIIARLRTAFASSPKFTKEVTADVDAGADTEVEEILNPNPKTKEEWEKWKPHLHLKLDRLVLAFIEATDAYEAYCVQHPNSQGSTFHYLERAMKSCDLDLTQWWHLLRSVKVIDLLPEGRDDVHPDWRKYVNEFRSAQASADNKNAILV
jgi:hypothetical protein